MSLKLVKLSKQYKKQITDILDEWVEYNNTHETNHSPWAIFSDHSNFDEYIIKTKEREMPSDPKYVPSSLFYAYDEDRDVMVGAVNIRHCLNDNLLKTGGHIGDGVRPSERRKGYATKMIALALEECKKLEINKVLITCDKDNIGSRKQIMNNGGIKENEIIEDDGNIVERYWIEL
ncbi:MAG: GNAT family N-acetyltransferase [Gammaproteobacteria bacterium]|nr:GNAT family N-acetyltransferase [Gammaproteobacteria bacterium]